MSIDFTSPVKRYHPALVSLHWLIAALVFITPLLASEGDDRRQAATIGGLPLINLHMILGISVLVLLFLRLIMRWRIKRPAWATTGSILLDRVGQLTHIGLYFFTFAVTITGLIFAAQTNRLTRILNPAASVPEQVAPGSAQLGQFPPPGVFRPGGERPGGLQGGLRLVGRFLFRAFHELSWKLLLALIILHIGAALFHQFWRKDKLLNRMWFGRTTY